MRSASLVVAVATGLLPAGALAAAAINLDVCSTEAALQYLGFTCRPIPEDCVEGMTEQANTWCRDYLSIDPVTVYATTVTPVTTETVFETATATTTSVQVDITTVQVLETTTLTATAEATVTETVTVSGVAVATLKRRQSLPLLPRTPVAPAPNCIDLTKKDLLRHPAARLSSACSCLDPQPTTVTLDATTLAESTATATETSTVIVVEPETSVATELATSAATDFVTVTKTTTTTSTTTTTPSPSPDACSQRFSTTIDLSLIAKRITTVPNIATSRECCQLCYATESCAGVVSARDGECGLIMIASYPLDWDKVGQCPYGWMSLNGVAPAAGGNIFKGPCWNY